MTDRCQRRGSDLSFEKKVGILGERAVKCSRHPDKEAMALCEKFKIAYCHLCCDDPELPEGCQCSSPNAHCQFRTRCIVWEMSRRRRKKLLEGRI